MHPFNHTPKKIYYPKHRSLVAWFLLINHNKLGWITLPLNVEARCYVSLWVDNNGKILPSRSEQIDDNTKSRIIQPSFVLKIKTIKPNRPLSSNQMGRLHVSVFTIELYQGHHVPWYPTILRLRKVCPWAKHNEK